MLQIKSLAVLPLENLSGDPSQEYFSDGMTEMLVTELGKINDLTVIPRSSANRFKNTRTELTQIARELNVDAIIVGSTARLAAVPGSPCSSTMVDQERISGRRPTKARAAKRWSCRARSRVLLRMR